MSFSFLFELLSHFLSHSLGGFGIFVLAIFCIGLRSLLMKTEPTLCSCAIFYVFVHSVGYGLKFFVCHSTFSLLMFTYIICTFYANVNDYFHFLLAVVPGTCAHVPFRRARPG